MKQRVDEHPDCMQFVYFWLSIKEIQDVETLCSTYHLKKKKEARSQSLHRSVLPLFFFSWILFPFSSKLSVFIIALLSQDLGEENVLL